MEKKFIEIFSGLKRAHGCTYINTTPKNGLKLKTKSFVKRENVTDEHFQKHLNGVEPTLGIIPINEKDNCRWGCIDVDSYAGFDHKKLLNKIKTLNLPLIICRSKSGGAHIFLFIEGCIEAKILRDKLNEIRAILGFGNAEVFPKQIELKSEEDTGNFLNLPYFGGDKTTRYAFKNDGTAASLEEFYTLYEIHKVKPENVSSIKIQREESEFSDGPPCIETLSIEGISEPGRNNALFHFAIYAKKKWPNNWKEKISWFHAKYINGDLEQKEIDTIKNQHDKKDWGWKCNDVPMCNHCDKQLCKTRQYGIGNQAMFPELSDLQEIQLEEPSYYLNVDGKRLKIPNAKYLRQQPLFEEACIAGVGIYPPSMKLKDWKTLVNQLLSTREIISPPTGTSKKDQLKNHLEEFCTNRTSTTVEKEDIKKGSVFTENGKHYFLFDSFFYGFLQRRRWDVKFQETSQMLKEHCECTTERMVLGKSRPTITILNSFEKRIDDYKQKELKPKAPF
jgi:hypothetical protein